MLQLLALLERAGNVEPEELLDKLPPGGERVLVSDILLSSSSESAALYCQGTEGELTEILIYLECETLTRRIKELKGMLSDQSASRSVEDQQKLGVEMVEVKNRLEDQQKKYTPFSL